MTLRVLGGDCLELLPTLPEASVDACVTDPPYGLSFMGKNWDHGVPGIPFWKAVFRVLKPGGHILAFGGSRTYHRLACAIEDAGFEIRDQLQWIFGSGFPKSLDVSKQLDKAAGITREKGGPKVYAGGHVQNHGGGKQGFHEWNGVGVHCEDGPPVTAAAREWQGWGTALKPAHEPIVLARKPLIGTVAANVLAHGTGALNVDGCRVTSGPDYAAKCASVVGLASARTKNTYAVGDGKPREDSHNDLGRWPANVILDGSEEVVGMFPSQAGGKDKRVNLEPGRRPGGFGDVGHDSGDIKPNGFLYDDSGSAARFFYSAKADADDRLSSKHPTVKPVDLMAYLCRLVTPPKGLVLDPFAGSGSTGMACMREGFDCILIEREREYYEDILRRMAHVEGADTPLFSTVASMRQV